MFRTNLQRSKILLVFTKCMALRESAMASRASYSNSPWTLDKIHETFKLPRKCNNFHSAHIASCLLNERLFTCWKKLHIYREWEFKSQSRTRWIYSAIHQMDNVRHAASSPSPPDCVTVATQCKQILLPAQYTRTSGERSSPCWLRLDVGPVLAHWADAILYDVLQWASRTGPDPYRTKGCIR